MKPLVIYHANCADGFGAAFAAWLKFGDDITESEGQSLTAEEHLLVKHFRRLPNSQRRHLLAMVQSVADLAIK